MMKVRKIRLSLFYSLLIVLLSSCNEDTYPKPRGQVRLEYPDHSYVNFEDRDSRFSFETPQLSNLQYREEKWLDLIYPKMKATIHLSYHKIENNYQELLQDVEKLTYNHSIKADGIIERVFENEEIKSRGMLYEVEGNAASNIQFYLTDSTSNLISGTLYFYCQPNYDSLQPAINYIKEDVIKLMETLKWGNSGEKSNF